MSKLVPFLAAYPDIRVEVVIDQGLTDIVSERFDAGIRLGEQVDRDMIATRIGPDIQMGVVGSPVYFAAMPRPVVPQDLTQHRCINLRLQTQGGLYGWEFTRDGRDLRVRVAGQLTFNRMPQIVQAALAGVGLAMVPVDRFAEHLAAGRLVPVLQDWWPSFAGH